MIGKSKAEIKAVSVVNKVFLLVLNVETLNTGWWFFLRVKRKNMFFVGPAAFVPLLKVTRVLYGSSQSMKLVLKSF